MPVSVYTHVLPLSSMECCCNGSYTPIPSESSTAAQIKARPDILSKQKQIVVISHELYKWKFDLHCLISQIKGNVAVYEGLFLELPSGHARVHNEEERVTSSAHVPGGMESLCLNLE